jgi:hypothetical protein
MLIKIENFSHNNPMSSNGYLFSAGCSLYKAEEFGLVYEFLIRDFSLSHLCKVILSRQASTDGDYLIFGVDKGGISTKTRWISEDGIKDWKIVAKTISEIIKDVLGEYI